jgi:hypothetical protein
MKPSTNIVLLVLVALASVAVDRALIGPRVAERAEASDPLEGEVLAVDPPTDGETSSLARKASIKLRGGEIVRASVGGCIISPGQTTRLVRMQGALEPVYLVAADGK